MDDAVGGLIRHAYFKGLLYTAGIAAVINDSVLGELFETIARHQTELPFSNHDFQKWRFVAEGTFRLISVSAENEMQVIWLNGWISPDLLSKKIETQWWIDQGVVMLPKEFKP